MLLIVVINYEDPLQNVPRLSAGSFNYQMNTWVELSEKACAYNLAFFKQRIPARPEFSVVVKVNVYGPGIGEVALRLSHSNDFLNT
jgi:hypothetical protein